MKRLTLAVAFSLALVACGDDDAVVTTTQAPTTSSPATTVATTTTVGAVSGLDLVKGLRARGEVPGTTTTTGAEPTTTGAEPTTTVSVTPDEFITITDDTGQIELRVPASWDDIDPTGWIEQGELIGPGLVAAPDVDAWRSEWGTPGVFIGASDVITETTESILDLKRWDTFCTYEGRDDYDDGLYVGRYDLYFDCGDELSVFIVIAATPPDGSFLILVEIVVVAEADLLAADEIIRSFLVSGVDF
ncbi:MAG: hypothetical protein WEE36_00055 [Acidimicrobiia bacterium]